MPLPVPNLDDRTFDELVAEGRSLIPRYTREWTNHNLSDPGITLLELFAYLTEAAIFQLDQVPEESIEPFLALVGEPRRLAEYSTGAVTVSPGSTTVTGHGTNWTSSAVMPGMLLFATTDDAPRRTFLVGVVKSVDSATQLTLENDAAAAATAATYTLSYGGTKEPVATTLRRVLEGLERRIRAVTAADFSELARELSPRVARSELVVMDDPVCAHADPHPGEPMPVGILLVVPTDPDLETGPRSQALVRSLHRALRHRLVVTTRLHVAVAESVEIRVDAEIARRVGSALSAQPVVEAIERFLDRLRGGPAGEGWPFGRYVYRSELFQLLEAIPEVDHVESLALRRADDPADTRRDFIELGRTQLVRAPRENIRVTIRDVR